MSSNFELLQEIDNEADTVDNHAPDAVYGAALKAVTRGDDCSKEMLRLVQSIFLSTNGGARREIAFCGVDRESGSSSICASAGQVLSAISSRSVCLVDANVQLPRLSAMFGVETVVPFCGKSPSIRGQCSQIGGNLWLAGTDLLTNDNGALLSLDRLRHLFAQLSGEFEYVLIDAPGTSVCGDAATLGQVADAVVLVIEADNTRRLGARKGKETLDRAGVRLLGTVLHNRSFPIPEGIYNKL